MAAFAFGCGVLAALSQCLSEHEAMPAVRRGSLAVQARDLRECLFVQWDGVSKAIVQRRQVGAQKKSLRDRRGDVRIGSAVGLRGQKCQRRVHAVECTAHIAEFAAQPGQIHDQAGAQGQMRSVMAQRRRRDRLRQDSGSLRMAAEQRHALCQPSGGDGPLDVGRSGLVKRVQPLARVLDCCCAIRQIGKERRHDVEQFALDSWFVLETGVDLLRTAFDELMY